MKFVRYAPSPIHATCCVSPTAPTPSTLPASSVSGLTLEITTSATRLDFSSSTPRRMFWPWMMIDMNSSTPTTRPATMPACPDPPRPASVTRSVCIFSGMLLNALTTLSVSPSRWRRTTATDCLTAVRRRSMSATLDALRPA